MTRTVLAIGGLAATLLSAGCHNDSDSPATSRKTPPPAAITGPEGSWSGTIDTPDPGSRQLHAVVLADGDFWMLYTRAGSGSVGGIVQGNGSSEDGVFRATAARLLSLEDDRAGSADLEARFVPGSSLGGTLTPVGEAGPVTLPAPATFSSLYQLAHRTALTLTDLAGHYSGIITTRAGAESANVTISEAGAIAGASSGGCSLAGQAAAEGQGNVFRFNVSFGNEAACGHNAATQVFGIVTLEVDKATAVAMDLARNNSFIFTGIR